MDVDNEVPTRMWRQIKAREAREVQFQLILFPSGKKTKFFFFVVFFKFFVQRSDRQ